MTLLSEREGAGEIGAAVRDARMAWTWVPMASGRPPEGRAANQRMREAVEAISAALDSGESVFLHCSAGMHRTGMFAYALLRRQGLDREAALAAVERMRSHTRAALGEEHLDWVDRRVERPRS